VKRLAAALLLLVLATGLAGCGGGSDDRTLTVLAAASLTDSFQGMADEFRAEHPGVEVRLVFDSSATLADKAVDHAPGDVLATADERTMRAATEGGGTVGTPREFATNEMVLVVPRDNPAGIDRFADLDDGGVDYLTCVRTAPCGAAARALLQRNHVDHPPVSEEVDVRAVLGKVMQGEADAGLVYRTDAKAAGDAVRTLPVPGARQQPNTYWVAVTPAAGDRALARAWVSLVLGDQGRAVLSEAGFGPPGRP
jgi:molybdate transport system substrate-binding protein